MSDLTPFEKQRQARLDDLLFRAIDEGSLSSMQDVLSSGANPNATRQIAGGTQNAILAATENRPVEIARQFVSALMGAGAEPLDISSLRISADNSVSDESILAFAREFEKIKVSSSKPK